MGQEPISEAIRTPDAEQSMKRRRKRQGGRGHPYASKRLMPLQTESRGEWVSNCVRWVNGDAFMLPAFPSLPSSLPTCRSWPSQGLFLPGVLMLSRGVNFQARARTRQPRAVFQQRSTFLTDIDPFHRLWLQGAVQGRAAIGRRLDTTQRLSLGLRSIDDCLVERASHKR